MRKPVWLVAAILVLAVATGAHAGGYVGLYAGGTFVPDQDIKFDGMHFPEIEFETSAAYGGKAGYWCAGLPWVAVELNVWSQRTGARDCPTDLTLVNFSGSLLLQYLCGGLRLYGGGGVVGTWSELDTWPKAEDAAVGWLVQGGLEIILFHHFGLFGEYRYVDTHFDFADDIDTYKIDFDRQEAVGGLNLHF